MADGSSAAAGDNGPTDAGAGAGTANANGCSARRDKKAVDKSRIATCVPALVGNAALAKIEASSTDATQLREHGSWH